MVRSLAAWKLIEDMMLELKVAGVEIPAKNVEDLRTAKSLLKLGCMPQGGDAVQKAEELLADVEAYVATEGQRVFGEVKVYGWLRKLEEANLEVCAEPHIAEEGKFVTGIPCGVKWVRIEATGDLSSEKVGKLAKKFSLQVKAQNNSKLVVYGSPKDLKAFVKRMAAEKLKP